MRLQGIWKTMSNESISGRCSHVTLTRLGSQEPMTVGDCNRNQEPTPNLENHAVDVTGPLSQFQLIRTFCTDPFIAPFNTIR